MRKDAPLSTLGGQIRAARLQARMSQTEVERRSGIPKARLSRYENNHVAPSIASLAKICKAIGVKPGKLVDAVY
jgi:transcriptional regulator with XRE-family HTH domain